MEMKRVGVDEAQLLGDPQEAVQREANRVRMSGELLDMMMPAISPTVAKLRDAQRRAQGLKHSTILRG